VLAYTDVLLPVVFKPICTCISEFSTIVTFVNKYNIIKKIAQTQIYMLKKSKLAKTKKTAYKSMSDLGIELGTSDTAV